MNTSEYARRRLSLRPTVLAEPSRSIWPNVTLLSIRLVTTDRKCVTHAAAECGVARISLGLGKC